MLIRDGDGLEGFDVLFGEKGGCGAVGGCCCQLADFLLADVAGGEDAGEIGAAVLAGEDAAALCHLDLALEEVGVRHDADVDEDGVDGQLALLPFCLVVDGDARQFAFAVERPDLSLEQDFDLRIGVELVL